VAAATKRLDELAPGAAPDDEDTVAKKKAEKR
jgi:hypothetical protein